MYSLKTYVNLVIKIIDIWFKINCSIIFLHNKGCENLINIYKIKKIHVIVLDIRGFVLNYLDRANYYY